MKRCGVILAAVIALWTGAASAKLVFVDKTLYEGSNCTTQDGRPGICSYHCDAITDHEFRSVGDMCGFDRKQVTVCCPKNATTITVSRESVTTTTESPIPPVEVQSTPVSVQSTPASTTSQTSIDVVTPNPSTTSIPIPKQDPIRISSNDPFAVLKEACNYRTRKQKLRNDYIAKIKKTLADEVKWRLENSKQNKQKLLNDEEELIANCKAEGAEIGGDMGMQYTQWCETLRSQIIYTEPEPELEIQTYNYSHMAVLGWTQSNNTVSWNCGATLIHKNFLLTAAHCIFNTGSPPNLVRIADSNLLRSTGDKFAIDYDIEQIVTHELYDSITYYNDIALIRVKMQPRFSEKLPPLPACLWTEDEGEDEIWDSTFTTLGYGAPSFGQEFVLVLKVNELSIVSNEQCSEFYENIDQLPIGIRDHQICAADSEGLTDTCEGDSGGPLQITTDMIENIDTPYLMGITSFGLQCMGGNPGVYTKVNNFLEWIEKNMREMMQ